MSTSTFPAIVATGPGPAGLQHLTDADLPEGDVTVAVSHSSLNYKDGLAVTGQGKIARSFPMVCGIDLAGTVETSDSESWRAGDDVIVTGWGLSETHPGGFTLRQRIRSEWIVARPDAFSLQQTMAIGTAGLTAMLCVMALEDAGLNSGVDAEVLVTGAGGGVGSVAVALLARLGYRVAASTGRAELHDYLRSLGATTIVDRETLSAPFAATRQGAVGGGDRQRRQRNTCGGALADPLRRSGRRLRAGGGNRPAHDRVPVHPARGATSRSRLGLLSHRSADRRLDQVDPRPAGCRT